MGEGENKQESNFDLEEENKKSVNLLLNHREANHIIYGLQYVKNLILKELSDPEKKLGSHGQELRKQLEEIDEIDKQIHQQL